MTVLATLGVPTRSRDWRLMGRTIRLVLSVPRYAVLSVTYGLVALSVFVLVRNLALLRQVVLFGDVPPRARLRVFLELYPGVGAAYTAPQTVLLWATAGLVGVDLALVTYHLIEHSVSVRRGSGGMGGVLLGTIGAGCASCGSALLVGLLSVFGASGLVTLLPLDGLEFSLLALVVLLLSIHWIAEGLRGGTVRGCPVDVDAD